MCASDATEDEHGCDDEVGCRQTSSTLHGLPMPACVADSAGRSRRGWLRITASVVQTRKSCQGRVDWALKFHGEQDRVTFVIDVVMIIFIGSSLDSRIPCRGNFHVSLAMVVVAHVGRRVDGVQ